MMRRILLAVDGSDASTRAVAEAASLGAALDSELHIIHVTNYQQLITGLEGAVLLIPEEEFEKRGIRILEKAQTVAEKHGSTRNETHLVSGDPARVIANKASEISADLIAIGSKGHGNLSGLLMGSVSQKVCHLSECSCLVVK